MATLNELDRDVLIEGLESSTLMATPCAFPTRSTRTAAR